MKIGTKFFGEMEIDEKGIFTFETGIPGFLNLHEFVVINEENSVFSYLQAVSDPNVCFVMLASHLAIENYDFEISESTVKSMGIESPEDIMVYVILNISSDAKMITANLKAPIIINIKNNKGIQEIIDDERYSTKYKMVKERDV